MKEHIYLGHNLACVNKSDLSCLSKIEYHGNKYKKEDLRKNYNGWILVYTRHRVNVWWIVGAATINELSKFDF